MTELELIDGLAVLVFTLGAAGVRLIWNKLVSLERQVDEIHEEQIRFKVLLEERGC